MALPSPNESGVDAFKSLEAGLAGPPVVAVRINSDIVRWRQDGNRLLKTKIPSAPGGKYVGLEILVSTESGEPLAIFPDGVAQRTRVASSGALLFLTTVKTTRPMEASTGLVALQLIPARCAPIPIYHLPTTGISPGVVPNTAQTSTVHPSH